MHIIIKYAAEIHIKSNAVRKRLMKLVHSNLCNMLKRRGYTLSPKKEWDRIVLLVPDDIHNEKMEDIQQILQNIPGIGLFYFAKEYPLKTPEDIADTVIETQKEFLLKRSFCVRVKRSGVHPFRSIDIERFVGGEIKKHIPRDWKINLMGEHNKLNISLAVKVLEILELNISQIKKGVESYKGEPGRFELIRKFKGIVYYNDTNATTPDALIAALKALYGKSIILIAGGNDKNLDYKEMVNLMEKKVKALILIKGTATDKIISYLSEPVEVVSNMKEAFIKARSFSKKDDIVLLCPGAASFGVFKNEYDRGEQFIKLVKKLK